MGNSDPGRASPRPRPSSGKLTRWRHWPRVVSSIPRPARATFTNYYQDWGKRQVWESNTVRAMNLAARSVPFANLPLGRIRRSNVEQWVKATVVADLAAGTIKTRFNDVRSVFRAAVRDRLIPHDPSEGVAIPRQRRREAAMRLPTHEQVDALMQAADPLSHSLRSPASVSVRPQPSRSATSTSSARSWPWCGRSSEPTRAASN